MTLRTFCLGAALAALGAGSGLDARADCAATLENLLAQRSHPDYGRYAYEVHDVTGETATVERFDPARPAGERWVLLAVDGRQPTAKEFERVRKHRAGAQDGYRFESLFDEQTLASLQVLDLGADRQSYSFTPAPSPGEDEESQAITRQLRGQLVFEQAPGCHVEYRLQNEKLIRPARGVKIERFELAIRLAALPGSGLFYPVAKQQEISGRAFLVKGIDQVSRTDYLDHELVIGD